MGGFVNMGRLRIVSLFSGCGGMDLGVLGGFKYLNKIYPKNDTEIVFAIDNDVNAVKIYNDNFNHKCTLGNIENININEIPKHNILIGGFPCQSFSIIAQNPPRLGMDDKKGILYLDMIKILEEKQPDVFIAENVKGLLSANNKKAFPLLIKSFEDCGYYVKYKIMNASDFNIPQKRERIFIVGYKKYSNYFYFNFPTPITNHATKKVPISKILTEEKLLNEKYFFSEKAVNGMLRVKEKMNKGRVQNIFGPCNTINAHLAKVSLNGTDPVLITNGRYRRFTPREAARIQSFPEKFKLSLSEFQQYKVIGNAVPPVLMWYITNSVIKALSHNKIHNRAAVA